MTPVLTLQDQVGTSHLTTSSTGVTEVTPSLHYDPGRSAWDFDGANGYASITNFSFTADIGSIGCWVNADRWNNLAAGARPRLMTLGGVNNEILMLSVDDATNIVNFWVRKSGTIHEVPSITPLAVLRTYFVVGVFNGSQLQIWINAVRDATQNVAAGTLDDTTGPLILADRPALDRKLDGRLSGPFVTSTALSGGQIMAMYRAGLRRSRRPMGQGL